MVAIQYALCFATFPHALGTPYDDILGKVGPIVTAEVGWLGIVFFPVHPKNIWLGWDFASWQISRVVLYKVITNTAWMWSGFEVLKDGILCHLSKKLHNDDRLSAEQRDCRRWSRAGSPNAARCKVKPLWSLHYAVMLVHISSGVTDWLKSSLRRR